MTTLASPPALATTFIFGLLHARRAWAYATIIGLSIFVAQVGTRLMGWPVSHSRSPEIHNHWIATLGLKGAYVQLPVHPDRLHAELAIPIVYVSHAVDEVARLADRVVLMEAGRVVGEGPVSEVLAGLALCVAAALFVTSAWLFVAICS